MRRFSCILTVAFHKQKGRHARNLPDENLLQQPEEPLLLPEPEDKYETHVPI